jgi:hypothetical protein
MEIVPDWLVAINTCQSLRIVRVDKQEDSRRLVVPSLRDIRIVCIQPELMELEKSRELKIGFRAVNFEFYPKLKRVPPPPRRH